MIDPFLVKTGLMHAEQVPLLFKLARPVMVRPVDRRGGVARAASYEKLAGNNRPALHCWLSRPQPPGSRNRRRASRLWRSRSDPTRVFPDHCRLQKDGAVKASVKTLCRCSTSELAKPCFHAAESTTTQEQ